LEPSSFALHLSSSSTGTRMFARGDCLIYRCLRQHVRTPVSREQHSGCTMGSKGGGIDAAMTEASFLVCLGAQTSKRLLYKHRWLWQLQGPNFGGVALKMENQWHVVVVSHSVPLICSRVRRASNHLGNAWCLPALLLHAVYGTVKMEFVWCLTGS